MHYLKRNLDVLPDNCILMFLDLIGQFSVMAVCPLKIISVCHKRTERLRNFLNLE